MSVESACGVFEVQFAKLQSTKSVPEAHGLHRRGMTQLLMPTGEGPGKRTAPPWKEIEFSGSLEQVRM